MNRIGTDSTAGAVRTNREGHRRLVLKCISVSRSRREKYRAEPTQ